MPQQVSMVSMDGPNPVLEELSRYIPALQETAGFGQIGRYYTAESLLVRDEERQC